MLEVQQAYFLKLITYYQLDLRVILVPAYTKNLFPNLIQVEVRIYGGAE